MSATTKPRRRWLRFSLRTVFVLVTVFAVWLGWNVHQVRERDSLLQLMKSRRAAKFEISFKVNSSDPFESSARAPLVWSLLGARSIGERIALQPGQFSDDEIQRIKTHFPESSVYVPTYAQTWPWPELHGSGEVPNSN